MDENTSAIESTSSENNRDYFDKKFDLLMKKLENVENIKISVQTNSNKINSLEEKVKNLEREISSLKNENQEIQKLVNRKNLIITGLQDSENETNSELKILISQTVNSAAQLSINANIDQCIRLGKFTPGKCRPIRISFLSQHQRDLLLNKKKMFTHPVYLNEDLPYNMRAEHNMLRKMKKEAMANQKEVKINWKEKSITIDGVKSFVAENTSNQFKPKIFEFRAQQPIDDFLEEPKPKKLRQGKRKN